MTREEILAEIEKCAECPTYFINNYVKVVHPVQGIVPFHLFPFQERIINEMTNNRFSLVKKFRQAGITTLAAAYSLWTIIFQDHKNVMVVSIGDRESRAFLGRVAAMYDDLPAWLKPSEIKRNQHILKLSTGSEIKSQPAGAGRGESVSLLIVDEAAFVDKMREFWMAIYPTISTGGSACLISTVNGMSNLYYELYNAAKEKENNFHVIDINWEEHPWYTPEWYEETRPNMSDKAWLQEYECEFLGTGDTFIDRDTLAKLNDNTSKDFFTKYTHRMRVWKEPQPYYSYMITADCSYGREQDNSAFHVINLYNGEQVAEFYSNVTPIKKFGQILNEIGTWYNTAYLSVERNALGMALLEELWGELEYENLHLESAIRSDGLGVTMNRKVKRLGCSTIKDIIENRKLVIHDKHTIIEMSTFVAKGQSYEASDGNHDDLMMNLVMFGYFSLGDRFADLTDINLKELMFKQRMVEIENDVVPFGYIDDGLDDIPPEPTPEDPWCIGGKPWVDEYY